MKKTILITLALTTALASINPTTISANKSTVTTDKQTINEPVESVKSYSYEIDGVKIESNVPLSK